MVHPATGQGRIRRGPAGRRSRHTARRAHRVEFTLTDEEFGELDAAAADSDVGDPQVNLTVAMFRP